MFRQIWFQNRRQVTRRKSRPLLPHEIIANLKPSLPGYENAPTSSFSIDSSSQSKESSSQSSNDDTRVPTELKRPDKLPRISQFVVSGERPLPQQAASSPGTTSSNSEDGGRIDGNQGQNNTRRCSQPDVDRVARGGILIRSFSETQIKKSQADPKAHRRSASFAMLDDAESPSAKRMAIANSIHDNNVGTTTDHHHPLKRANSFVRLAMSLDGKAEVTTRTGTTPSPPRAKLTQMDYALPRQNAGLQRSFSAIEPSRKETFISEPATLSRRPMPGRSRDARTWEFYCDRDARDALNEQAEREESGSATAAIALIKSNSNNAKMMMNNGVKRHTQNSTAEAEKRSRLDNQRHERPRLGRSKSSIANMQTVSRSSSDKRLKGKNALRKSGLQSGPFEIYEGDSDKENWIPGTQTSNVPRRQAATAARPRGILEESLRHSKGSKSLTSQRSGDSLRSSHQGNAKLRENGSPTVDDEVAAFMSQAGSTREADDLDCVQNLLSLSQAVWR